MPSGPGADSPRSPRPRCVHCHKRAGRTGRNGSRGLCNVCYRDAAIRERYPAGKKNKYAGPCVHCQASPGTRGHRLCRVCYADSDLVEHYRSRQAHGYEGRRVRPGKHLPARPTDTLPGTEEKIRVLECRARRGEQLHHPLDAKLERDVPIDLGTLAGVEARHLPMREPAEHTVADG